METAKQKAVKKDTQDWVCRALGTVVALQHYGLEIPRFPMGYAGYVISVLSGRDEDVRDACKKFVNETQPILAKAEAEREKSAANG